MSKRNISGKGDAVMISWKKIHNWMVSALEEPFLRAELHRVDMLRNETPRQDGGIRLMERDNKRHTEVVRARKFASGG